MPRLIAFLRAINVGGHNVTMKTLRELFESLGLGDVETFIASGNVIFTTETTDLVELRLRIEQRLESALGYEVTTFLRTDTEVAAVARYKPFDEESLQSAGALNVAFLAGPLDPAGTATLMSLKTDIDDFHVHGQEVYWLCTRKQSESKFSNGRFEKALKVKATFRGINSVTRLAAKLEAS